jgi:hypothetical protein
MFGLEFVSEGLRKDRGWSQSEEWTGGCGENAMRIGNGGDLSGSLRGIESKTKIHNS